MFNPLNHPILLLVLSGATFWLAAKVGQRLHVQGGDRKQENRDDFTFVLGGTLTLLGLIIGFTFSMAVSRYDQRKNDEEQEANAIGTEYVRADLLPAADADKVRALLNAYLVQRLRWYRCRPHEEREINAQTARMQTQMWTSVSRPVAAQPTPVAAVVLSGMNDVLNSQGYTQASWWNRIPTAAWMLLIFVAVFCNMLVGFGEQGRSASVLLILPIALSVSLFLIADIDSPRGGVIRVQPQNLESLSDSLHLQ